MTKVIHATENRTSLSNALALHHPTQEEIDSSTTPSVLIEEQIIDNPGRGNCCFYAFAIGLIHIIQEESIYNNKATFEQWVALLQWVPSFPSIQDQYDAICAFKIDTSNFHNTDLELLNYLQRSLRLIIYHGQLDELKRACTNWKSNHQELVGNSIYIRFAEFYYNRAVDGRYNEFATSPEIKAAFEDPQLKVKSNFEHLALVPLFLSLIYGNDVNLESLTLETNPSAQSPVISAMRRVTRDFFWGTHHDLNYLANIFKVNLHTLENRVAGFPFVDLPECHTITINNRFNVHWTTQITLAKKTSGFSFMESEDSLEKKPLIGLATSGEPKSVIKNKPATEEGGISALKLLSFLTPVNDPLISPSQLNDQSKHNLELPGHELGQISKKENKPDEDIKQLEFLREAVSKAVIAYTKYSEGIWFSLFHRHGNTGRVRARTFYKNFLGIENSTDAKSSLIRFLANDNNNGNTHPHSFRTMLLQELQTAPQSITLQYTSEHFNDMLKKLASDLSVNIETVRPQR